jgi:hypothetical protein
MANTKGWNIVKYAVHAERVEIRWWVKETCTSMVFAGNCDAGCKARLTNLRMGGSQNIDSVAPMGGSAIDVMG